MTDDKKHLENVIRPDPDPTTLTTAQIFREHAALKELIFVRLDGMDKAIDLFHDNLVRAPTDIDKQIGHLKELVEETFKLNAEKFTSIQTQFKERDVRSEQTLRDSKVAIDAALQASKEAFGEQNKSSSLAIAKSEASTMKQIDQQSTLIATATKGLDDKISDMKDRLTRIEGADVGKKTSRDDNMSLWAIVIAGIAIVVSILIKLK